MSDVLALEGLGFTYPGAAAPALRDVDLRVAPGELVVVCGPSAGGKSTLLRAACGLVPHVTGGTASGRVLCGGRDTREHGPAGLSATVGVLGQDPETQVVMGTVRGELALGLEQRGHGPAAVARAVQEAALVLGIAGLLDRRTHELSGGELQRVALGAAIAGRPPLLLLDEPTSQLDPVAGTELIWLLRRLNEEHGTAVVLVEHRLERCLAAADRLVVVDGGTIACDAPPADALAWAAVHQPGLLPPAARLAGLLDINPLPTGVKQARAALRARGLAGAATTTGVEDVPGALPRRARRRRPGRRGAVPALELRDVWRSLPEGRHALRAVDLEIAPGERVCLMGANGAGKSSLLRCAAGLDVPTRGRVRTAGRVALLLQHPGDYVLHDRVGDEAPAAALAAVGLAHRADRHPRDLSGGERQRLALAVVLGDLDAAPPALVALDEPTRGMDAAAQAALLQRIDALADAGAAVVVSTHDAELAAAFADRVVLLADGRPIADAAPRAVLASGWHFATETARVLGGRGGALLPAEGARVLLDDARSGAAVAVAP